MCNAGMTDDLPAFPTPRQSYMLESDHQTPVSLWPARHVTPKIKSHHPESKHQASKMVVSSSSSLNVSTSSMAPSLSDGMPRAGSWSATWMMALP